MSPHDRIRRQQLLVQAEGYLELGMARHALDVLAGCGDPKTLPEHGLYLQGQCLRELGRYHDALEPLSRAAKTSPDNISIWLALGWCYKRTGKLDRAMCRAGEEFITKVPVKVDVHIADEWAK